MISSKSKGLIWIAVAIVFAAIFAAGMSAFVKIIPFRFEKSLAEKIGLENFLTECSGAKAEFANFVSKFYPIYPDDNEAPVTIKIVKGETVNAFAMLGGTIFVYDGLLQELQSPNELAGILAHELEHVRQRHVLEGTIVSAFSALVSSYFDSGNLANSQLFEQFLKLRFSRSQEHRADESGLKRLHDAKLDTRGFQNFFDRLDKKSSKFESLYSDHPASDERAQLATKYLIENPVEVATESDWKIIQSACKRGPL